MICLAASGVCCTGGIIAEKEARGDHFASHVFFFTLENVTDLRSTSKGHR